MMKQLAGSVLPDELQALVATLRGAEERLAKLTGGEVDSITDADGRTFLLHRAQESLRYRDAAQREAILNSLPANIALLDAGGYIVAVNEAWRVFGMANGLAGALSGMGSNYVDICHAADGAHAEGANGVADGLAAVLDGSRDSFVVEYPCHSPTQQRWFQLTATPLVAGSRSGVVVMHLDVSARKQQELTLRDREAEQRAVSHELTLERARLVTAQRVARIGSWETELSTMQVLWSEETYRIHEIAPDGAPMTHARFLESVHPDDRASLDAKLQASLHARGPALLNHRLLLPDGRIKFIEERWQVVRDADDVPTRVEGTCQDVTERKLAELHIERLNRGYRVLSQVSALIVRVTSRDELFREACDIAVDPGGFVLAWVGEVDASAQTLVRIAASEAGTDVARHLDGGLSLADDDVQGHGPLALAARLREPVIVNDIRRDARVRDTARLAAAGIRALAAQPILVGSEVVAVIALYSADVDRFDDAAVALLQGLANDIGFAIDHLGKSERINYLAFFDPLTGLANRRLFLERTAQCLRSAATMQQGAALVLLDLERFKSINDSLGLHAGDDLLRQVAAWLLANLQAPDLLARVGADHFALLLLDGERPGDAVRQLEHLVKAFHEHPFRLDVSSSRIAARFGVAVFPDDASAAEALFQKAESALKNAKATGSRQLFYTQKMTDSIARRLAQENRLRHALDNEEFILHYQPKIRLLDGLLVGAEALIRWQDPASGTLTPPGEFIPILEETGLIIEVGRWAMRRAIEDYLHWRQAGLPAVRIAVNVSPVQLRDPAFVNDVGRLLAIDPLAHRGLEIEITESMIMSDMGQSIATLSALRGMGLCVAIDDFGTGFSSLGYLSRLPVDTLKIDRTFIDDMGRSQQGLTLVSTMITLAHSFHLEVVAEGVETQEQASLLKLLRCEHGQGYLYSRAIPADEFEIRFLQPRDVAPAAATPPMR